MDGAWNLSQQWKHPRWWLSYVAILLALVLSTYVSVFTADPIFAGLLAYLLLGPLLGIIALIVLIRCGSASWKTIPLAATLYFATIWLFAWHLGDFIRNHGRWLIYGSLYRAQLDAQPAPPVGTLKHIEWDGWGFAGNETVVYVVFDPDDALASAARSGRPGKFPGISCEVYGVRRLSDQWYAVNFYTDTGWDDCA